LVDVVDVVVDEMLKGKFNPSSVSFLSIFGFRFPCTGAPFLASKPQFLDADASLLDMVTGLTPNRSEHDIFLHLEMVSCSSLFIWPSVPSLKVIFQKTNIHFRLHQLHCRLPSA